MAVLMLTCSKSWVSLFRPDPWFLNPWSNRMLAAVTLYNEPCIALIRDIPTTFRFSLCVDQNCSSRCSLCCFTSFFFLYQYEANINLIVLTEIFGMSCGSTIYFAGFKSPDRERSKDGFANTCYCSTDLHSQARNDLVFSSLGPCRLLRGKGGKYFVRSCFISYCGTSQ